MNWQEIQQFVLNQSSTISSKDIAQAFNERAGDGNLINYSNIMLISTTILGTVILVIIVSLNIDEQGERDLDKVFKRILTGFILVILIFIILGVAS